MRSRESRAMACHTRFDERDAVSGQRDRWPCDCDEVEARDHVIVGFQR